VGVVELDSKHAFANIALTDNVVRFATRAIATIRSSCRDLARVPR